MLKRILYIEDDYNQIYSLERRVKHPIEWLPTLWCLDSLSTIELAKWSLILIDFRGVCHSDVLSFFNNLLHPNKYICSASIPMEIDILDNKDFFVCKSDLCGFVTRFLSDR